MKRFFFSSFLLIFLSFFSMAQNRFDLVPLPVELIPEKGVFCFLKDSRILVSSGAEETAIYFLEKIKNSIKHPFHIHIVNNPLQHKLVGDIIFTFNSDLPKEGYTLLIDTCNVTISANDASGLFYGVQTLLQLLPPTIYSSNVTGWEKYTLPSLFIKDYPRFGHRGLMLDVSRQFYDVATVKKYFDWMSMHKLNVFHWHLTDDNGWRVEIKKYPKLTQLGAWRGPSEVLPPSYGSGNKRYGGYYTQKEIKEVVAYAKKLHINIIPEIDMPGHAKAVTASYPEILCESEDLSLSVNGENLNLWCVGREANFSMLNNIIAEIAQLFPWYYIHIGGDEVNPGPWKSCPHCQALLKKEGMTNVMDLQGYFVRRMEKIVEKHGKKMIGWDEIIDRGDINPQTTVHAWRNVERGLNSIRKGYPTIMQPAPYTYLDMKQSSIERGHSWAAIISLERIYSFDPIGSAQLSSAETKLLLGVQSGLWGELLDRPFRFAEYQLFPRLCALAEIGWTPQELRKWEDFNIRIHRTHFDRMYEMGIAFRVSPPLVSYTNGMLIVTPPFSWSVVRYSSNEMDPEPHSSIYHYPIFTNEPWKYRFATFYRDIYMSPVISGALRVYKTPITSIERSFPLNPNFKDEFVTDYKQETYIRSGRQLVKGDYIIYHFSEPLNSDKITFHSGIPGIPIYYVEDGDVSYSLDGKNFIYAGNLVYGSLSFSPPKGIVAVKITLGLYNYALQNAFMDLLIQ